MSALCALMMLLAGPARADEITIKIFNGAGERVRTLDPLLVPRAPTSLAFTYTAGGACAAAVSVDQEAFSPDGDCRNDLLVVRFAGVTDPVSVRPAAWWDGTNDAGRGLSNGVYLLSARHSSTSAAAGPELLGSVTLASARPPVRALVSNAAGIPVADLPSAAYRALGRVRADTPVFAPVLDGSVLEQFLLYDRAGAIVARLSWSGKDARGHVVPNGDYLFDYVVTEADGAQTHFSEAFVVQHAALNLLDAAVAIPNPAARGAARVWFRYRVLGAGLTTLVLKIYAVTGEAPSDNGASGGL
ncbi:MAG: hypothetical protein AAB368_12245, partial [bacterium]